MEESTRQNLVMAFSNVVRTSGLAGVVDVQRASMGFSVLLERDSNSTDFNLGDLHTFLVEQGGPVPAIDEICVFLKTREGRFGLQMHLPPHLAALDDTARDAMVQAFTSRGATTGTRVGRTPISGTISPPQQTGTTAPPKSGTWEPPKQEPKRGPKRLYAVFGVLVVAGIVNLGYMVMSRPPPPQPIAFTDPAGLPCVNASVTGGNVLCYLPNRFVKENSAAVIDAKAAISLTFVQSRGHRRLLVMSIEDNRMIRAF